MKTCLYIVSNKSFKLWEFNMTVVSFIKLDTKNVLTISKETKRSVLYQASAIFCPLIKKIKFGQ